MTRTARTRTRGPQGGRFPRVDTHADDLARRFQEHRFHLNAVAYRMLGSLTEAEDAVQEAWIRLSRTDASAIDNLPGWLTTVVGRVCLDMLRSRKARGEESLDVRIPDPVVDPATGIDPEHEAMLADTVGLALLVVLDTLAPAERLAFVLHDMFAVSFDAIAEILERTPASVRQLASRARRRVQESAPSAEPDPARQREVVEAFLAAARGGDFEALVGVLDPNVVLRADSGVTVLIRGAEKVASQAIAFRAEGRTVHAVFVNGAYALVTALDGVPASLMAFTVVDGHVAEMYGFADPQRLAAVLDGVELGEDLAVG